MYVEKKLDTMEELEMHMKALDEDEGIRTVANSTSSIPNGYVFITKSNQRYCINICERVWDPETLSHQVGGNDRYYYFDTFEEAWGIIQSIIQLPIEAWLY